MRDLGKGRKGDEKRKGINKWGKKERHGGE